ncbi:hypothetical protein CLM62_36915 [Streptomyces sp. SA15]|nr:hypothetical protein CLM62_36915 [Streptomyces sp. SA15]
MLPLHSDGFDVGSSGHVVGSFGLPAKGFVLHSTTGLVDLTAFAATPGMTIIGGTGVNASRQVTALAEVSGATVGVLITP